MDLITLHYAHSKDDQDLVAIHFDDIAYIDETSEGSVIYFREGRGLNIEWIKVKEPIKEIKGKYNAERIK